MTRISLVGASGKYHWDGHTSTVHVSSCAHILLDIFRGESTCGDRTLRVQKEDRKLVTCQIRAFFKQTKGVLIGKLMRTMRSILMAETDFDYHEKGKTSNNFWHWDLLGRRCGTMYHCLLAWCRFLKINLLIGTGMNAVDQAAKSRKSLRETENQCHGNKWHFPSIEIPAQG